MSAPIEQATVAETLVSAGISPARCGRERTGGLSDTERELYHWVLSQFAERGRPSGEMLRAKAFELGLEPGAAISVLAGEDLVHLDTDGEIKVAYPFSGQPTRHRVLLAGGHEVDAMCAIDALGMAAMLGEPVEVRSSDPDTGVEITVHVDVEGQARWEPTEAVVVAGSCCDGPSYRGCCSVLNFFGSSASAERYLSKHEEVRGRLISVPDALAAGAAVFGQALAR